MDERAGRAWHVFATYLAAVAGIFATTSIAFELLPRSQIACVAL